MTQTVGPGVQGIIDALDPMPAVVYNSRYDVLATNPAYRDLFTVPQARGLTVPNVLWTLFTVSEETCPVVHREVELPVMVATLRSHYGRHVGEPAWVGFVRRLSAGQRRRLALARLIASPRPLWLLDEPLAPLDAARRERFGALMADHLAGGGLE